MHTYKVVEENKRDVDCAVIEKGGITVQFTLNDLIAEQRQADKFIKELKAKLELEEVKKDNYEKFHPFVLEMSDEDIHTAHLYFETRAFVNQIPKKIEELETQVKESKEEEDKIRIELGLDKGPISPESPADANA